MDLLRRDAAHALLDAVAAFDPELLDSGTNERAVRLALRRLPLSVSTRNDAAPAVGAALDLLVTSIHTIAHEHGVSPEAVVRTFREHCDDVLYPAEGP